jgi:excisionase family DNA binding protein
MENYNPFASIDQRLSFIETTLAMLAAKELPTKNEARFYSIDEAAMKLNISRITIYRNCQAGKIPHKKVGARVLIPGSFVDK